MAKRLPYGTFERPTGYYVEIGRKGGQTALERYGPDHFKRIGKAGGDKTLLLHGTEHFSAIGRIGKKGKGKKIEKGGQK